VNNKPSCLRIHAHRLVCVHVERRGIDLRKVDDERGEMRHRKLLAVLHGEHIRIPPIHGNVPSRIKAAPLRARKVVGSKRRSDGKLRRAWERGAEARERGEKLLRRVLQRSRTGSERHHRCRLRFLIPNDVADNLVNCRVVKHERHRNCAARLDVLGRQKLVEIAREERHGERRDTRLEQRCVKRQSLRLLLTENLLHHNFKIFKHDLLHRQALFILDDRCLLGGRSAASHDGKSLLLHFRDPVLEALLDVSANHVTLGRGWQRFILVGHKNDDGVIADPRIRWQKLFRSFVRLADNCIEIVARQVGTLLGNLDGEDDTVALLPEHAAPREIVEECVDEALLDRERVGEFARAEHNEIVVAALMLHPQVAILVPRVKKVARPSDFWWLSSAHHLGAALLGLLFAVEVSGSDGLDADNDELALAPRLFARLFVLGGGLLEDVLPIRLDSHLNPGEHAHRRRDLARVAAEEDGANLCLPVLRAHEQPVHVHEPERKLVAERRSAVVERGALAQRRRLARVFVEHRTQLLEHPRNGVDDGWLERIRRRKDERRGYGDGGGVDVDERARADAEVEEEVIRETDDVEVGQKAQRRERIGPAFAHIRLLRSARGEEILVRLRVCREVHVTRVQEAQVREGHRLWAARAPGGEHDHREPVRRGERLVVPRAHPRRERVERQLERVGQRR